MRHRSILFAIVVLAILFINQVEQGAPEIVVSGDYQVSATSLSSRTTVAKTDWLITHIPAPPPELDIQSALVKDMGNSFYFLELNINQHWPLASLTKLLTAVVALENLEPSDRVNHLIRLMMIISNNQAAEQLAEMLGQEKFIAAMRAKTQALDMNRTSIFDVTGLSFLNQSTVKDIEKLVDYIIKNHPRILQYSRETEITVADQKYLSINRFAGRPDFMGGKTGYTDEASGNLISIFQHHGQPILFIVLGTADRYERFQQTELLLKWISKFYK